ncbi:MAG: hypothetical protein ACRDSZ_12835 [Pseudonocardiaceae bacterium]
MRGRRLPHDKIGGTVDRDHALRRAGLRVPDPQFSTTIPAGRRSSCPVPLPPGGQPNPRCAGGPLRWARCPHDGRLHLLQPDQIRLAAAGDHARALCGQQVPAEGLTITNGPAAALGVACMIDIPVAISGPGPRGTAP